MQLDLPVVLALPTSYVNASLHCFLTQACSYLYSSPLMMHSEVKSDCVQNSVKSLMIVLHMFSDCLITNLWLPAECLTTVWQPYTSACLYEMLKVEATRAIIKRFLSWCERSLKILRATLQSLTGKLQGRITTQGDPCSHYREWVYKVQLSSVFITFLSLFY